MITNILKTAIAFSLVRKPITIPRQITTTTIFAQEKKADDSKVEKKIESKQIKSENKKDKKKNPNYYKFFCKCEQGFNNFSEFLEHVKNSHQIKDLNFSKILTTKNGFKRGVKFYWHLTCSCGNKFSSSLCNADLKVKNEQIELVKKYRLRCLRCNNYAKFDKEDSLNKFLEERFKQKLIYNFYKEIFEKFEVEKDSDKELKDHKQDLCEKCQALGRFCGGEGNR